MGPVVSWLQTVMGKPAYIIDTKTANPAVLAGCKESNKYE
jgi:hypothetical protein